MGADTHLKPGPYSGIPRWERFGAVGKWRGVPRPVTLCDDDQRSPRPRNTAGAGRLSYEPFMQRIKELGAQGVVLSGDPNEGGILGNVRPRVMPAGRGGAFISRTRGSLLVQTALTETDDTP